MIQIKELTLGYSQRILLDTYELDTAYNFEFTVTTQTGEDKILVVSERSDVK